MAYDPEEKLEVYASAVRGLVNLEADPERRLKYLDFIDIYAALDDEEQRRYREQYAEEADLMSGFAERFIDQGLQQGLQQGIERGIDQGIEQGIEQGLARLLGMQIEQRFGALSPEVMERLRRASPSQLEAWGVRVLSASTVEEIFDLDERH
ncbi:DUF4351 domain-containing protein [Thiorhodococcus minor]|uniref:DUF4351 domain-containing protein n=1 Tax=Thiorhodococcus minor TaxID=57489 RepID=UPI001FD7A32E|nr:DUF4351 domain-containing protein [Thiorhodococcus minor]